MTTRESVTYDHGVDFDRSNLERIYDRLRKKSLRSVEKATWVEVGVPWPRGKPHKGIGKDWIAWDHAAYTAGVRDALNAVRKEGC